MVELKDKVSQPLLETPDQLEEAMAALVGLGASPLQACRAVQDVIQADVDGAGVEEVIRRALKRI